MPSYIVKMRQSYGLQRSVPRDLQQVIGKRLFKEPGGPTLSQARARVTGFLQRTDAVISTARGKPLSAMEELITTGPVAGVMAGDLVEISNPRLGMYLEDGRPNPQYENLLSLAEDVQSGKATQLLTTDGLLQSRRMDRDPAPRTFEGWVKALEAFMTFTQKERPYGCTRADAVAYKDHLLTRMTSVSAKTQLAYLAGLWTTLIERQGTGEHIFKGLPGTLDETTKTKALRAAQAKRNQSFEPTTPIDQWNGTIYLPVFHLLYYTGCRLAEVAALRAEDIHSDYISVEWQEDRSLKTANSVRDIPLHPSLIKLLQPIRKAMQKGHLWPALKTTTTISGVEVIRWGHNLSKPCKKMTGLKPKDFRDRFATQLRDLDFNQVNIERLMGHSSLDTNSTYGGKNWDRYVQMINSIS